MNAQHLAALGTMVREAITEHCKALGEVFAQQLSERDQQIELLTGQLQQLQNSQTPGYDDTEIKQAVQALRESVPAPYDDGEIRQQFKQLSEAVGESAKLADRIEEVAKSVPAAYDDSSLRQQIEEVSKSVPAAYDDAAVREELKALKEAASDWGDMRDAFDKHAAQVEMQIKAAAKPADGRDALQLEVLPAIDEAKSYTRGTYAKHAGGLWRAFEQTSGMRGWECIVEGVKELQVDMIDKRLSVKAVMSSGALAEMVKELPIQIYRGVFKSEGPYHQGDTVTWAGSLWHCNVTGTKALPGDGSADWTLAVKKGRDGREVVKTERAQGPVKIGGAE